MYNIKSYLSYFKSTKILFIYYCILVVVLAIVSVSKPDFNWDMLGYVAAAKHFEISDPQKLHQFVYENLKKFVSKDIYYDLTDGGVRKDWAENANDFYSLLPFYEIRPLYNLSILLLSKIGVNIFAATYLVSIFSVILGIFILLFALKEKVNWFLLYIFPFCLYLFCIVKIARLSTPDAMAFLCVCIFIYLFSKERIKLLLAIIPIFVAVRTDLIIFNFISIAIITFLYKNYRIRSFVSLLLTIVLYELINTLSHNYGYFTIFSFTLIRIVNNPANINSAISISDYLRVLFHGLHGALTDAKFMSFVSIILIGLFPLKALLKKDFSENKEIMVYFAISIFYIFIHFILFPVMWSRFFVGFYTMGVVGVLLLLSKIVENRKFNTIQK